MAPRQQWFETLRLSIQQEHGKGWSIWEVGATKRNPIGRCSWCHRVGPFQLRHSAPEKS